MDTHGKHLIIEYKDCGINLSDIFGITEAVRMGIKASGATELNMSYKIFENGGVSAVFLLSESHVSIHTWPESSYASLDFYTCGHCSPGRGEEVIRDYMQPNEYIVRELDRGWN